MSKQNGLMKILLTFAVSALMAVTAWAFTSMAKQVDRNTEKTEQIPVIQNDILHIRESQDRMEKMLEEMYGRYRANLPPRRPEDK